MASISVKAKIYAVEQCYAGAGSLNQIAERFGVHRSTLQKWLLNYDLFGEQRAAPSSRKSSLSGNCKAMYKLCSAADISRAGYDKWLGRTASSRQLEDERLAHLIVEIYQSQRGVPGYRQMQIILDRRYGVRCNRKRVHRLMRILDLRSVCRRKKRTRRKKLPVEYLAENILDRSFTAKNPNEKWLTGAQYIYQPRLSKENERGWNLSKYVPSR